MNRRTIWVGIVCLMCGVVGALFTLRSLDPVERRVRFVQSAVENALEQRMPAVDLSDVPLDEALASFAKQWGIGITLDQSALAKAGVDMRRRVSLRARDVNLDQALLALLAVRPEDARATYVLERGRIIISPVGETDSALIRVYDLDDLLPPSATRRPLVVDGAIDPDPTPPASDVERMEELVSLIQETVDPDSWRDAGGSVGMIRTIGHKLVVAQTWHNHYELRRMLDALRTTPVTLAAAPQNLRIWNASTKQWGSPNKDPQQVLWQRLGPVELNVPFSRAFAILATRAGMPIWMDEPSMKAEHFDVSSPVSIHMTSPRLIDVLKELLKAETHGRLGMKFDAGTLVIRASDGFPPPLMVTRVYDLHEWLGRLAEVDARAMPDPDARGAVASLDETVMDDIIRSLKASFDSNRGCVIRRFDGLLFVTDTPDTHDEIESILGALQAEDVESIPAVKKWKAGVAKQSSSGNNRGAIRSGRLW